MVGFFRYAFAAVETHLENAIKLAMSSEGALNYSDVIKMREWQKSYSSEIVIEMLRKKYPPSAGK